jgi:GNAT superfamily N-acetyltransferase
MGQVGVDIIVRDATVKDTDGIARVWVDGWRSAYTHILPTETLNTVNYDMPEALIRQHLTGLPDTSALFVAVEDGTRVVGVALVRATQSGPKGFTAELDAIYVLPSQQQQGVGHRLVLEVARWSEAHAHGALFLWVVRGNPYRRFYDVLGAELLNQTQEQTFGDHSVIAVAYGWRDLRALILRLEKKVAARSDGVA